MTTLEIVLLMLIQGFLCISSFIVGAKTGQKVVRGETIESPVKSPIKTVSEVLDTFEQRKLQERDQVIADNIDAYDGTSVGQKDIPIIKR